MSKDSAASTFGELLLLHRLARELSQDALAERADISTRAVSDLERGVNRTPQAGTLNRLIKALDLLRSDEVALRATAIAVRKAPPKHPPSTARQKDNLPHMLTSFIGRRTEIARLTELLLPGQSECRLLTLTGVGGCGKSRLALAVASAMRDNYVDGVFLVELAALRDPELVPQQVATVLGLREQPPLSMHETLTQALSGQNLLLLLDNCEHLRQEDGTLAAANLAHALLSACPHLHILATSRVTLGVKGEKPWPVPSLGLPDSDYLQSLEELVQVEAVQLLLERAKVHQPDLDLTEWNAWAAASICRPARPACPWLLNWYRRARRCSALKSWTHCWRTIRCFLVRMRIWDQSLQGSARYERPCIGATAS